MTTSVPVIDISPFFGTDETARRRVAEEVNSACANIGFLIVTGHRVPAALIDEMRSVSRQFFDLPTDQKLRQRMPADRYRGYIALGNEALANSLDEQTPPDLKESFSIGPMVAVSDEYHRSARPGNSRAAERNVPSGVRVPMWASSSTCPSRCTPACARSRHS